MYVLRANLVGGYVCVYIYVHILKRVYVEKERDSKEGVEIEHLQEELRFLMHLFFFHPNLK